MHYILISFLRPFFFSLANIIEGKLANTTFKKTTTMIFYISLMNFAFLPLLLFLGRPTIPSFEVFCMLAFIGAVETTYLYPYYMAVKKIDVSIVTALFSLGQISIPIMSFFILGEKLLPTQYLGFFIIIITSIILSIDNLKMPKLNKAFYYMTGVSLLLSFYMIVEKNILNIDDNWINVAFYPTLISGLIPSVFLLKKDCRKDIVKAFPLYKKNFKLMTLNELICFGAIVATAYGLSGLSPVVLASIAATVPIFTLVISYILTKAFNVYCIETLTKKIVSKKLACFCFIIAGVALAIG
ncbi:MAG: EamA family transporter [Lactobacillaceae bacterium]|nr:EamA family transporter [Lactobacillaceae bacterium]